MPEDKIRFYIDPQTGLPHFYKHGISEQEVEEVLSNADEDRRGRRDTREVIGQTDTGRCILIVYRSEIETFVITAYELKGPDLIAFLRRRRRRWRRRY